MTNDKMENLINEYKDNFLYFVIKNQISMNEETFINSNNCNRTQKGIQNT